MLMEGLHISESDREAAEELKTRANEFFAQKKYEDAIALYTSAISYNPQVAAYYANRAFAYVKSEMYGAAIRDAEQAITLDPSYVKGYYRRAVANMALGKLKEAVKDFRDVVKFAPRDTDARSKLIECEKEYKRREFEKAIAVDEARSILQVIGDVDNIYDGPHIPETGITLEFIQNMMEHFRNQKKLHLKYVYQIMKQAYFIFKNLGPIVDVPIPCDGKITVCGDIHGQYYDLLNIFDKNGLPSPMNPYLFNGDFVDRGSFSVECILTLLAFKCLYPECMYLSRGNHETNDMNRVYGFEGEVKAKFTLNTFKFFAEIFNAIPLGQVIADKILVVHGGLFSQDGVKLEDLRKIDRFRQPGSEGLMCELLWSDPQPMPGRSASKRGVGIQFGPDVTDAFLKDNGLQVLIRSHEVKQEGYAIDHDGKCITIFSAPNYCDSMGNKGAYIHITPDLHMEYIQFEAVPHPTNVKPMQYASNFSSFGF